jgi:hypothetical protein
MKILLEDFNAKEGREDVSKTIIGKERKPEASKDIRDRVVNFANSRNQFLKYNNSTPRLS